MGIVSLKVPQGGMIEAIVRLPSPLLGSMFAPFYLRSPLTLAESLRAIVP